VFLVKEIAVLQHPQRSSNLGQQRQLLKQRRRAVEMRQQRKQGLKQGLQESCVQESRIQDGSSLPRPQQLPVQSQGIRSARSHRVPSGSLRALPAQRQGVQKLSTRRTGRLHWLRNCFKLSFMGLGLSAVVGTAIAIFHPEPRPGTLASSLSQGGQKVAIGEPTAQTSFPGIGTSSIASNLELAPDKELKTVKFEILSLSATQLGLTPGIFIYNPETGAYLDIAGDKAFSAASTIKFPVLVAFLQDVDAKRIKLDELLPMRKDLVASESGDIQYQPVGTKFSALETANLMITISDNTATNMLIDRLGGMAALNQRFKSWGLMQTTIRNPLPDLQGTNTISPKDLSTLMLKVAQGEFLSPHSRDRALEMMRNTVTNTLLTPGLGEGAKISHKTGDIGSVVGDVGLIEMPSGQRYVATAMVQRPHNDPRAQELIRQMSRISYQALNQKASAETSSATTPAAAVNPRTSP
jgi:beta-lactamase class A